LKHNVGIAVDEWGIIRLSTNREIWRHINLTDALVTGLHLNAFIRHARSVRLANFPRMPTSIGINISQPGGKVMLQTNFYAFELFSRTCGQESVDVYWSGETFSGKYLNHEYNGVRALDVTATLDKQKKQLMVYVVNQSKDKALETTISLTSGVFNGNVTASVVNGPDVKSENTAENPHQVGLRETVVKADGKAFVYTFEPHSITALMCEIK
jgi:alpha-N-arabinofuranosidase